MRFFLSILFVNFFIIDADNSSQKEKFELVSLDENVSMDNLIKSITANFLTWNDSKNIFYKHMSRVKGENTEYENSQVSEYISVNCRLTCWIFITTQQHIFQAGNPTRVLMCKHNFTFVPNSLQIPIEVKCMVHKSGKLLHIILNTFSEIHHKKQDTNVTTAKLLTADVLSEGFSYALKCALLSVTTEPETLYLTIEVPIIAFHYTDFNCLSTWLRHLSICLSLTTVIDRNILTTLTLNSFKAEGCDYSGLSVVNKEIPRECFVELIYSCPERDYFVLVSDKETRKKHCSVDQPTLQFNNIELMQGDEPMFTRSNTIIQQLEPPYCKNIPFCSCEDIKAIVASFSNKKRLPTPCSNSNNEYKSLLTISLWINAVLSVALLIMILLFVTVIGRINRKTTIFDQPSTHETCQT